MRSFLLLPLFFALGCTPEPTPCVPTTCSALSQQCGFTQDGCGNFLDCGGCASGQSCMGQPGRCTAQVCTPSTCESLGACGQIGDGCGGLLECGGCQGNEQCTADNRCVCIPRTCGTDECGTVSDGCGGMLACGGCGTGLTCTNNRCSCQPRSCAQQGATCGTVTDSCGTTLNCGTCPGSTTCGGGGVANQCGCRPKTCTEAGAGCGPVADGCGGMLSCGTCTAPLTCGASSSCEAPSSARLCEGDFCWLTPQPTSRSLKSVSPVAGGLWLLAEGGIAYVSNGTTWRALDTGLPTAADLYGVDLDTAWVVGGGGTIRHYDAGTWTTQPSGTTVSLRAISGVSATAIWAIGASGTWLKYDGTQWTAATMTGVELQAVHARAVDDVWMGTRTGILRWNGTMWTSPFISVPTSGVTAVFGVSSTVAFAGDGAGGLYKLGTSSFRKDTRMAGRAISAIFATSGTSAVALASGGLTTTTEFMRYTNTSWALVNSAFSYDRLSKLRSADGVTAWAVGDNGALWKYTAAAGFELQTASLVRQPNVISSSTGADLAVAALGSVYLKQGSGFVRRGIISGTQVRTHSAHAVSATDVWFVGERSGGGFTSVGTVHRFNGTTFTDLQAPFTPTSTIPRDVCALSASEVWIVGDAGAFLRWRNGGWSLTRAGTLGFNAVWCQGTDGMAVGESGSAYQWNGSALVVSPLPMGVTQHLLDVDGSAGTNVWAVGTGGTVLRHDGATWTVVTVPGVGTTRLNTVKVRSATDVWIGSDAELWHYDGMNWSSTPLGASRITGGASGLFFLSENAGIVTHP